MRTGSNESSNGAAVDCKQAGVSRSNGGGSGGRIYIVGLGPGLEDYLCRRACDCIAASDAVVGYKKYIQLVEDLLTNEQQVHSNGMTREIERCEKVIELAADGLAVSLVSSGDPGVYGMAGILFQLLAKSGLDIPVEVVPGITAANAAAAVLGAPLMHDYATISLSDLLTPWDAIIRRVELAARGDFVIALYNPKSKKRVQQIEKVREILLAVRPAHTPVGIVRNARRQEESVQLSTIEDFTSCDIDMFTVVIIGNSHTYIENGRMVTPRGYQV